MLDNCEIPDGGDLPSGLWAVLGESVETGVSMRWREDVEGKIDSVDRVFVTVGGYYAEIEKDTARWIMCRALKRDLSWSIDDDGDLVIEEKR